MLLKNTFKKFSTIVSNLKKTYNENAVCKLLNKLSKEKCVSNNIIKITKLLILSNVVLY